MKRIREKGNTPGSKEIVLILQKMRQRLAASVKKVFGQMQGLPVTADPARGLISRSIIDDYSLISGSQIGLAVKRLCGSIVKHNHASLEPSGLLPLLGPSLNSAE